MQTMRGHAFLATSVIEYPGQLSSLETNWSKTGKNGRNGRNISHGTNGWLSLDIVRIMLVVVWLKKPLQ